MCSFASNALLYKNYVGQMTIWQKFVHSYKYLAFYILIHSADPLQQFKLDIINSFQFHDGCILLYLLTHNIKPIYVHYAKFWGNNSR